MSHAAVARAAHAFASWERELHIMQLTLADKVWLNFVPDRHTTKIDHYVCTGFMNERIPKWWRRKQKERKKEKVRELVDNPFFYNSITRKRCWEIALTSSARVFSCEQRRSGGRARRLGIVLAQDPAVVGQSVDVGRLQVGIPREADVIPTLPGQNMHGMRSECGFLVVNVKLLLCDYLRILMQTRQ